MSENKEGRNLEKINTKNILNFGDLSRDQRNREVKISQYEAWIKCERCNNLTTATWKNNKWSIGNWSVYLKKAQIRKHDIGYYIVGGIKFYCPDCDRRHNYLEKD